MRTATPVRMNHAGFPFAATVILALLPIMFTADVAAVAHSPLESSTPAAGSRLVSMPEHIELAFRAAIANEGASVVLLEGAGEEWTAGTAVVEDTSVTVPVTPDAPDGRHGIRWKVTSFDGAPHVGRRAFRDRRSRTGAECPRSERSLSVY